MIVVNIVYSKLLLWTCKLPCKYFAVFVFALSASVELDFYMTPSLLALYDRRQLLPSPWCGLWVAVVMQTAERSLVSSSG